MPVLNTLPCASAFCSARMYTMLPFPLPSARLSFLFTREKKTACKLSCYKYSFVFNECGVIPYYIAPAAEPVPLFVICARSVGCRSIYAPVCGVGIVSPVRVVSVTCPALRSGVVYGGSVPRASAALSTVLSGRLRCGSCRQ